MRQPTKAFSLAKQEDDLKTILNSLFSACVFKYNEKTLKVEQKILIYKIVDFCKVTSSKAKEYLNILESRGKLEIQGDLIIYNLEQKDEIMEINKL